MTKYGKLALLAPALTAFVVLGCENPDSATDSTLVTPADAVETNGDPVGTPDAMGDETAPMTPTTPVTPTTPAVE